MADAVRLNRDAMQILASRGVGLRSDQPTSMLANQRTRGNQSDVYAMPVDGTNWHPLQDLDVESDTFGAFFFLPGYDTPGDTTKVVL